MDAESRMLAIGERIDQLIIIDVAARGVIGALYEMTRARMGSPLCMSAAALLEQVVSPGDVVIITTGWPDRPLVNPGIAESDGPVGAAALARALHRGLGAVPVIVTDEILVGGLSIVMRSAGFRVVSIDEACKAFSNPAPIHCAAVVGLPLDDNLARATADKLVGTHRPKAVIAIERGGMNEHGKIHTSLGTETSDSQAKADFIFKAAMTQGAASIGIGDGGNELGMGLIKEDIRRLLRHGDVFAPELSVDVLISAAVSNWGAYGVAASIAARVGRIDVFHDASLEEDLLRSSASASFIDGLTGYVEPSADGIPLASHRAIVTLLREIIRSGLAPLRKFSPLLD